MKTAIGTSGRRGGWGEEEGGREGKKDREMSKEREDSARVGARLGKLVKTQAAGPHPQSFSLRLYRVA